MDHEEIIDMMTEKIYELEETIKQQLSKFEDIVDELEKRIIKLEEKNETIERLTTPYTL